VFGFNLPALPELPAYLRDFEPARLQAIRVTAVAFLASVGLVLTPFADAKVAALVGSLVTAFAWYQGESTRAKVFSPATAKVMLETVPDGYTDIDATPADARNAFKAAGQDSLDE
jgi:hypothetical protein